MTSTQPNTRRRSARLAFEEEENGAPAKKSRTEEAPHRTEKRSDARVNEDNGKRAKKTYNDGDGDFQFSRKGSKKAQQKPVMVPQPIPEEREPQPSKPKPKVKKMLPTTPVPAEKQPKRRSVRLSSDKDQVQTEQSQSPSKKAKDKEKPAQDDDGNREAVNGVSIVQIGKQQDAMKIALPFADTPINKRNKELRKGHRRSSTGMRGRRASSLIDSGTSNAVPHAEVEASDFYKLISQDLPEPRRMKQLLVWCGTRALPNKPSGVVEGSSAIMAARVIQEELLKEFSSRSELSDWFNREDVEPAVLVKKPNRRNIQNAAKLKELEQEVERLQLEKSTWEGMIKSASTLPPSAISAPPQREPKGQQRPADGTSSISADGSSSIDASLLDPAQASILDTLNSSSVHPSSFSAVESRLQSISGSLELQIDQFADGIHRLEQYRRRGDEVADAVLQNAAKKLEERESDALQRAGTKSVDSRDVLRELSRTMEAGD